MFTKKIKTLSAVLAVMTVLFSACLKEETVELSPNPLEILDDKQVAIFKLDSVQMVQTFTGYRDVYIYYSHVYKTLPIEAQKRINGVAITGWNVERVTTVNQKIFVVTEQLVGKTLNIGFAFMLNEGKERCRFTTFPITVR